MPTPPRFFFLVAAMIPALLATSCAEERPTINRVQPNALDKTFFVGAKLSDPSDNPEFYYRPTLVDVDYGASQSGIFTASYAQTTARVGWEITEDLLVARLTYERVDDTTGRGAPDDDSGQVVAAFKVQSHFDIRRAYNPQTGEELNIVEENSQDRAWYERKFMRVDFSQNLVTSAYELDTLAALKAYADKPIEYEAGTYSVEDPNHEDAPVFSAEEGYFDVTNKVFAKPQMIETPWGSYPACFLSPDFFGGTGPTGNCNPVELKVRLSFRRLTDTDYEPVDWDGQRMSMFGAFTTGTMGPTRLGYDRGYGVVDSKWRRFANRHNIWMRSHAENPDGERIACTADAECAEVAPSSRCDVHVAACTIPYRERTTRPVVYYYGPGSDPTLFESAREVAADWDSALRHAVQTARYSDCVRDGGGVTQPETIASCKEEVPPTLEGAMNAVEQILFMCHNPVIEGDPEACGPVGRLARVGDLRYHMANIIQAPQTPSPWGILADATDPVTGEVVASSVNVWNHVTDLQTQRFIDTIRWYLGELSSNDVAQGVYAKELNVTRGPGEHGHGRGFSLLAGNEVEERLRAMDKTLFDPEASVEPPAIGGQQLVDWASAVTRERFGDAVLGRGNAALQSRFLAARGTPVEAELVTGPFLTLSGMDDQGALDERAMQAASPLRANFWQHRSALERERQLRHATSGRCVLEAGEPTGTAELGAALMRKFPVTDIDPSTSAIEMTRETLDDRNRKWSDYLRRRLTRNVLAHEMGHSMGLRHVFTSSFDALNYRPQYWQLRTRDKQETTYCTEQTTDGSSCIGPRWKDPITDAEREGMLMMWQQTSVMDYSGELSQDLLDIGPYDRAAIRFLYGDVTDMWDDDRARCAAQPFGGFRCSPEGDLLADQLDSFGGITGPFYGFVRTVDGARHYSQLDQTLNLIRDCQPASTAAPEGWDESLNGIYDPVIDGFTVNGTRCSGVPTDYVGYRDLAGVSSRDEVVKKFDALGRVRRPYMFASDEYADIGNIAVYRGDNGADAYEIANFFINEYEDSHVFDNHRRGRTTFSLRSAFARSYSRYHAKLKEMSKAYALLHELYTGSDVIQLLVHSEYADGLSRPHALAASLTFDHFTRMLTRPTSGQHFVSAPDAVGASILRSVDQAYPANGPAPRQNPELSIPEGTGSPGGAPILGGRPLHNALDGSKGYYATDYDLWVGSYYEKTLALDLLADSTDRFISQSRDDFHDGRYRNVSFATIYPEAMRRLIANSLTGDSDLLGWRIAARSGRPIVDSQSLNPLEPLGFRSWWSEQEAVTCWPSPGSLGCGGNAGVTESGLPAPEISLAVDPEVGFEVQKFIVFFSLVYLPDSWKRNWVDLMRIYKVGTDPEPAFGPEERVVFRDPLSGELFVAHGIGKETMDGRSIERGVGARVLEWANTLAAQAFEVETIDPVTGELTFVRHADDSACPIGVTLCAGQPVPKEGRAAVGYISKLEGYKSLIDFVRLTTSKLGFYGPDWRGVY